MRVPHATDSAALVRQRIGDDLARRGVSAESIDEVTLVATELIGNAVRHTAAIDAAGLGVDWTLDGGGVTVQVADPSSAPPVRRRPDPTQPGGRGLCIVDALCDDWGVQRLGSGKQVWAHVQVHRDAPATSGSR
jgi:anti-sigma regulatory factor (Ser/Thr protein kinase)